MILRIVIIAWRRRRGPPPVSGAASVGAGFYDGNMRMPVKSTQSSRRPSVTPVRSTDATIVPQGCSSYSLSDLNKIASANPVGCATLTGSRATNCAAAHDIVNARCGPANCADKKACLDARRETMGYFSAEISDIENCRTGSWKRDSKMKTAAAAAVKNLQGGEAGHQTAVDLVASWVRSHHC